MEKFIRIAILTLGFFLLLSCGGRQLEKSVEEFSGSEIKFRKLQQIFIGYDSSVVKLDSIPVLLVVYRDKNECVPCQIGQLGKYRKMVDFKQDVGDGYSVAFIFSPEKRIWKRLILQFLMPMSSSLCSWIKKEFSLPTIIAFRKNRNCTFSSLIKTGRLFWQGTRVIIRHYGICTRRSL